MSNLSPEAIEQIEAGLTEAGIAPEGVEAAIGVFEKAVENDPTPGDRFQALLDLITSGQFKLLTSDDWTFLAIQGGMRVALVLVILFVGLTIAGWVGATVHASLRKLKFDPTLSKFLSKLARWGVLLIAGVSCLGYFGVETTSFAAVLGAAGFAVGLAFQGTLSNFAAGAMLLVFRPFKVGDVVNVAGQLGIVDEIELFTTAIDTFDNRRIILPNGEVFGSTIENITHHPARRVDVEVGAAYDADLDATRAALEQAVKNTPGVLVDPEPAVVLLGLGASSVDWSVRGWAPTGDYGATKQALIRSVKYALDAEGIGIPFPQMDVHLNGPLTDGLQNRAA